jgi:4-amino-4-deoxy-L-arabinose transferase-like glycosyltransferase
MNAARPYTPLWMLLALVALGHLPLMVVPPLTSDEALYWEWSRHLALGYYTHPPLVGWANALVLGVLGTSGLTVRLTALGFHLGTLALLYRMTREVTGGQRVPLLAGLLFALLPVSLVLGTMTVTDCPLVFFWTATAWLAKRAVIDEQPQLWYAAGAAAGGMLLSKFFAVLFVPALLAFLLLHPRYRGTLARKEPWLALVIALLVFAPFVYWNATHDWLTLQFNLVNRQGHNTLSATKPLLYLAGQLLAASPVVFGALVVALGATLRAAWRDTRASRGAWGDDVAAQRARDSLWYYAVLTAVPLLLFLPVSLSARIGSHWTAFAMPTGSLVLLAWLYGVPGSAPGAAPPAVSPAWGAAAGAALRLRWPRTAWAAWVLLLATTVPLAVVMLHPRVLPQRAFAYDAARERAATAAKYWGWREAGERMGQLRRQYGSLPGGLWFSTRDYSDASLLGFYSPGREQVLLLGYSEREYHGKEFLYWGAPIKRPGSNTIFVMDEPIFPDNLGRLLPYFRSVRELETLVIRDPQGRVLRKFFFALGQDYLANEPDVLSRW